MARRPLDLYESNANLTRALLERVVIGGRVVEPCAGPGAMARVLATVPAVSKVFTNDIDTRHPCHYHSDAADPRAIIWTIGADWVITNPPFGQAAVILPLAFEHARVGVAFLLRLSFLEPCPNRADWLLEHKSYFHALLTFGQPRPSYTEDGGTDAVTTAWMVWKKERQAGAGGPLIDFVTGWNNHA